MLRPMSRLVLCPQCRRHARCSDDVCPFCGVSLASEVARAPLVPQGAKRAVLFAIGLSAGAPGCGAQSEGEPSSVASNASATTSESSSSPVGSSPSTTSPPDNEVPIYGAPCLPLDQCTPSSNSGSATGSSGAVTTDPDVTTVPPYGAPVFPDDATGGSRDAGSAGGSGGFGGFGGNSSGASNDAGVSPLEGSDASVAAGGRHDAGRFDAGAPDASFALDAASAGGVPNDQPTAVPPYGAPPDLNQP